MYFIGFLIFLGTVFVQADKQSVYCVPAQQDLKAGDVIFISNHNYLFRRVERDTQTWASHVGIAFKDEKNNWVVYESTWPKSTTTRFCEFLGRSYQDKIEIRRLVQPFNAPNFGMNEFKIDLLKKAATRQLGLSYDQGFDYSDDSKSFCSKFVYDTFKALSIKVGTLETFQDLFNRNPEMDLGFWKAWFFGRIPYKRMTVTPASQLIDNQFTTVYSHNNQQ